MTQQANRPALNLVPPPAGGGGGGGRPNTASGGEEGEVGGQAGDAGLEGGGEGGGGGGVQGGLGGRGGGLGGKGEDGDGGEVFQGDAHLGRTLGAHLINEVMLTEAIFSPFSQEKYIKKIEYIKKSYSRTL